MKPNKEVYKARRKRSLLLFRFEIEGEMVQKLQKLMRVKGRWSHGICESECEWVNGEWVEAKAG